MTVTIQEQFDCMTAEEHAAMKTKLLELESNGGKKSKADTLEGYARKKYFHVEFSTWTDRSTLEAWEKDPLCYEQSACAAEIERRRIEEEESRSREMKRLAERRQALDANPFDPRTEVSADARKIVAHLWIIFVLLPFVLGLLFAIVYASLK
jgi:hypothetical protein